MKLHHWILTLLLIGGAATAGWFAALHRNPATEAAAPSKTDRKILYYQSPMHPWIKAREPGKCTICGMDLSPVYEGEEGASMEAGLVTLGSNSISVLHVETSAVTRQSLTRSLRVAGTIDDNDVKHRRLSAYVDGRIDKLFINYLGQEVTEGEPLALFHSPMLLNLVREYQALAHPAAGNTSLPGAEHERMRQAAGQRLTLMGLSSRQIESLAKGDPTDHMIEILAPMSGTVVSREVYAGQYVKEGDRLFELADFSTMWFRFDAYEQDLAWLRLGQEVKVATSSLPGKSFQGTISFIDPNLNEATRSAKVRVELPNPLIEENGAKHRQFLHRLYAEGVVTIMIPATLTVPRSAVLNSNGDPLVYVDQGGGAYRQQKVKLGRAADNGWEVVAGLSEGERVVTSGNLLLDAQAQLNSNSAPPAAATNSVQTPTLPPLNAEQHQATAEFIGAADRLTHALGTDDLKAFNEGTAPLRAALEHLQHSLNVMPAWKALLDPMLLPVSWNEAPTLQEARKSFLPFGTALVGFSRQLRPQPGFTALRLYQCPMTSGSFPGAPKLGYWIQTNMPVRNPFFGASMPDCGTEIKP